VLAESVSSFIHVRASVRAASIRERFARIHPSPRMPRRVRARHSCVSKRAPPAAHAPLA
jgi:hypothetical protein